MPAPPYPPPYTPYLAFTALEIADCITNILVGSCTTYHNWKFQTARSRLYQSRFLQPNTFFAAFSEIYKIHKPSHRSKFKTCIIFAIVKLLFAIFPLIFDILQNLLVFYKIDHFSPRFSRNFTGIERNPG